MEESHYASTAYNPARIPQQPASAARSWLGKFAKTRLPWGNVQDVAPDHFLRDDTPESLRYWEQVDKERDEQKALGTYKPKPFEGVDLHGGLDHERFRYALLSMRSHFWMYLCGGGRFLFYLNILLSVFTYVVAVTQSYSPWMETTIDVAPFFAFLMGVPLFCWGLGSLVINKFPRLWFKPSRGPIWELSRRTGLITVFDYDNNGEYKKNGSIGEITAPFYEFDAYISTSPDRQGVPMNFLYLAHRYRDITINFSSLIAPDRTPELPCALWDFLQNYMDTSRPLQELPCFEKYRQRDPVTAAHDQHTGRNPRYWIDMDDETFAAQLEDMSTRVRAIDTLSRRNLMAKHVAYTD
jgi:hypothetical protein